MCVPLEIWTFKNIGFTKEKHYFWENERFCFEVEIEQKVCLMPWVQKIAYSMSFDTQKCEKSNDFGLQNEAPKTDRFWAFSQNVSKRCPRGSQEFQARPESAQESPRDTLGAHHVSH